MHLVLDPAQDAAHGEWLRQVSGAYEWWYFDALSDDGVWSMACIWFLGNPFSPYYRLSARNEKANPYEYNALFFALYSHGRLHAYHFTRFPAAHVCADERRPASLRYGPNHLDCDNNGVYHLRLSDENANRRKLQGFLTFAPPDSGGVGTGGDGSSSAPPESGAGGDNHFWLPAAPSCRVRAELSLREFHSGLPERVSFAGHGYHDHNWGTLPFAADIRDWYWARAELGDDRVAVLYHVEYHLPRRPVSHLVLFQRGRLTHHDPQAVVTMRRRRMNVFGTCYATHLDIVSGETSVKFALGRRLDSSPFYVRVLTLATMTAGGVTSRGAGMGEYFRPHLLSTGLVASATKARVVGP